MLAPRHLKVHFASMENVYHIAVTEAADVRYRLMTAFPFICQKAGLRPGVVIGAGIEHKIPALVSGLSKGAILDSGLFTLMFGSHAAKHDAKLLDKWYHLLTEFILEQKWQGVCVEVDCQKVLGVEQAWRFRERMVNDIPNEVVNVFHLDDGHKGLDRLIEFSTYIAISVPELRATKKKHHVQQIAAYIKNRKPSIKIHLLGCTEVKLLADLSWCTTADSTSWCSVVRYGNLQMADGTKKRFASIDRDAVVKRYGPPVVDFLRGQGANELSSTGLVNYSTLSMQCDQLKHLYATLCGDQD